MASNSALLNLQLKAQKEISSDCSSEQGTDPSKLQDLAMPARSTVLKPDLIGKSVCTTRKESESENDNVTVSEACIAELISSEKGP